MRKYPLALVNTKTKNILCVANTIIGLIKSFNKISNFRLYLNDFNNDGKNKHFEIYHGEFDKSMICSKFYLKEEIKETKKEMIYAIFPDKELLKETLTNNEGILYEVNDFTKNKSFVTNDFEVAKKIYYSIK